MICISKYDYLTDWSEAGNSTCRERFTSVDPLWEKYTGWTGYQYSLNNPINMVDFSGFAEYFDNRGNLLGADNDDKNTNKYISNQDDFNKSKELVSWTAIQGNLIPLLSTIDKAMETPADKIDRYYQESGLIQATDKSISDVVIGPKNKAGEENSVDLTPEANKMLNNNKTPDIFIHLHLRSKPGVFMANGAISSGDMTYHKNVKAIIKSLHNSIMINPNNNYLIFYNEHGKTDAVQYHTIKEILNK